MRPDQRQSRRVVSLTEPQALDPAWVGQKFASLARLVRRGYPVPAAVCLPVSQHALWREQGGLPEDLRSELQEEAERLGLEHGLSVRSSATLEDMPGASFAGLYKSFLDLRSGQAVLDAVESCFDAAQSESLRWYLSLSGSQDAEPEMAVILQSMVRAAFAGVAFSRDPRREGEKRTLIEAVPGIGDRLVSGRAAALRASVSEDGEVRFDDGQGRQEGPSPDLLRRLDAWLRELEAEEGGAVDLEWAAEPDGRLWILQLRPALHLELRQPAVPDGVWTRGIAEDLWADRLTPFMSRVMLENAPKFDFSGPLAFLGVQVEQPTVTVIDGYLYLNCRSFMPFLKAFPGLMALESVASLFPPGFEPLAQEAIAPKRVPLLLRGLAMVLFWPQANPALCPLRTRRWLKGLHRRLEALEKEEVQTAGQALSKLDRALEAMAGLQRRNQWPYLFATVSTWLLRRLTAENKRRDSELFLQVLRGGGRNVTSRIEREFGRLAAQIRNDAQLASIFSSSRPEEILSRLPPAFQTDLEGFLASYGSRSRSRSLLAERWREAPEQVLAMLRSLALEEQAHPDRSGALPRSRAPAWLLPVAAIARTFLDLREELRFALDRVLWSIRASLLVLGRETGLGRAVFFLTREEICRLLDGAEEAGDLSSLAEHRSRRAVIDGSPPRFYVHKEPVHRAGEDTRRIFGLGASPGRVRGRALVVSDPADARIEPGDILVARQADPGWTPIFSRIGGLAVEEGGLLNHCAIVAREVGLPLVVGAEGATRMIASGQGVTLDGTAGLIEIHEQETGAAAGEPGRGPERRSV